MRGSLEGDEVLAVRSEDQVEQPEYDHQSDHEHDHDDPDERLEHVVSLPLL
jgi:hypothetical protein